ncbi:MAG: SpoIVB peptidase [Lachnospiraceae bacterium]|nr:SpoIVB peptidase [Lachnospiraceae bacterium]
MEGYRRFLWRLLAVSVFVTCVYTYMCVRDAIPDELNLRAGQTQELSFNLPLRVQGEIEKSSVPAAAGREETIGESLHLNLQKNCQIATSQTGDYRMQCRLFGIFPLKQVNIHVVEDMKVIPAGVPIGIYLKTSGVMVIGTGEVKGMDGMSYEPAYSLVKSGDYIEQVNGETVYNKRDLIELVNKSDGQAVLTLRREGKELKVKVKCIRTAGDEQKMGIWVRDNTQGIGTITYVTEEGYFGALGHGINDVDTGGLMELENGSLYATEIVSVIKGSDGSPGALEGVIYYNNDAKRGTILKNTDCGIFGMVDEKLQQKISQEAIPICLKQEIKKGPAVIRCTVNGETKEYQVEIEEVRLNSQELNKGLVMRVTDQELLETTGGIVQGMSGSPIIQDGKLVGAVTHVFVNDSAKGYGIFIENMLKQ